MKQLYYISSIVFLLSFNVAKGQTGCDLNLIRQTFTAAGCTELTNCLSSCSMYFYNPLSQTGNAAQAWAQNYGANLISVQSASENNCIVTELNNNGFSGVIWIGFNDGASEGSFVWYDQSPVVYTNWSGGEPNNSGDEDCVQIYPNGMWNDLGCSSGGSKSVIEVNLCPVTTITPSAVSICAGQSVNLQASTILGSSPYTYSWVSNSGGFTSTSDGPTVTPLSTTTYSVTATDRYGCTSSTSIEITVNNSLNATVSGSTSVCKDAPAPDITFTGSSGTAPYTFTYSLNNGAMQTVTTSSGSSVGVPAPTGTVGTYTYVLFNVSDANGCSQPRTGTETITVTSLPTATISGSTAVCQDAASPSVTFTGAGGAEPYVFTYTINGGANQTVSTTSGNSVTVPVPTSSAGSFVYALVSVQSGNSAYCTQPQSGTATVVVNPLPTATISGTVTVCKDAASPTITFTGAGATAPYTFTYTLNGGSNQTITTTSGNSITLQAPTATTGTYIYALVNVEDASTTGCSQPQAGNATVTVDPLPTATIAGTTTVCKNSPAPDITFTGTGGTAPYTFSYTLNGVVQPAVTTTGGNSITVAVPTSVEGAFSYGLVSVTDASPAGCSQLQSGSAVVTVTPLPTAAVAGTTAVCKDAPQPDVTFTGANGTAPYTFTYTINGGTSQTVNSISGNSAVVSAPTSVVGTFKYKLVSVQDASTAVCFQAQNDSAIITVNPLPTALISGTTIVCQDAAQPDITFTGAGGTLPYTFTYTIDGGTAQTVTSPAGDSVATVAASTATAGNYTYTLVSVQDASSTACSQVETGVATITVNPLPTATMTGTMSVCANGPSPVITFTGGNAAPPYTFTYSLNGGSNQTLTTSVGNSATLTAPTNTSGVFTYTLISVEESSSTACSQLQDGAVVITVNPNPDVAFTVSDSIGCGPLCVNFTDMSSISSGSNASVLWDFGDGDTGALPNHCFVNDPASGGSVTAPLLRDVSLTVTSDNGCVTTLDKTGYITIYPDPVAGFNAQPQTASIVEPVISLNDVSNGGATWNWYFGDTDTASGQFIQPHTYADTGKFDIMQVVSNSFLCRDTAYQTIVIEPEFLLYVPSAFTPNGDGLNDVFECKGVFAKEFEIKIFDRWGNMVFASDDITKGWNGGINGSETVQQDVYVYSVKITDINSKKHDYKGIVTLVR
jgi:gliding motility-associated-like protein